MEYSYVAYDKNRKIVEGKLSATNETTAATLLASSGYQILSLKFRGTHLSLSKLNVNLGGVKIKEIVMFSRQMALLLSSGTDIVVSLDLIQSQMTNKDMKSTLGDVAADIRAGGALSTALRKYPRVFPSLYSRAIAAGEKSGNISMVMRQMADYMEKRALTEKKIRGALSYPIFLIIVAFVVVAVLVSFVLPQFSSLYSAFGANLPTLAKVMMDGSKWLKSNGLYILAGIVILIVAIFLLSKTDKGKRRIDGLLLRAPLIGRIANLNELSRLCRTMALLFKVGLPLPDIMTLCSQNTNNTIFAESLVQVQQELMRGEGLSKPMKKRSLFLPLMVQMDAVGEETGNLDATLSTVAESYEMESDERTSAAIGLIQPVMTMFIGGLIALIAITMVSAMYSLYNQV
jgi:type IV pilus assembly protein PilC